MTIYMKSKKEYDGKTGLPNYQTEIRNLMKERLSIFYGITINLTFQTKVSIQEATKITNGFINYVKRKLFKNDNNFFSIMILEKGSQDEILESHKLLPHIHGAMLKPNSWSFEKTGRWIRRKWQSWAKVNGSAKIKICDNENKWAWYCNKHLNRKDGDTWLVDATYL